ncbi:MAG: PhzF family phenazine biosynthesis protein [Verrucomicrobiota bacterium]|nr:PhzF family phenazine biosynthesis protein [Verrucomicrobiota bacterium]MCC6819899.1 PhzF family phenazine biosynthesis protein [Limisphaerales bacterium]
MRLACYHVDAFANATFRGNPAAVCLLQAWLPDTTLQNIAAENNLSETAFVVARGSDFDLRWFTPTAEMDLCGHATLAAAFVLFTERGFSSHTVHFHSRSGRLTVARAGDVLTLDFPARPATACAAPEALIRGLGAKPCTVLKTRDYLAVFASAAEVQALQPDFGILRSLACLGIIATAPGADCDFVSRFFAPAAGINEDPVTGSAHCTLIPYWSRRLGKPALLARQISARGGELMCRDAGERVFIGGRATIYLRGEIEIPE